MRPPTLPRSTRAFTSLLLALSFVVAACVPAVAEELKPGRGIRYTAGATTSSGWERSLVEGTPNLARFYWAPITSYSQKYIKAPLPPNERLETARKLQQAPLRAPGTIYVKPIHTPLPVVARAPVHTATEVSAYVKPVHVPLPTASVAAKLRAPATAVTSAHVSAQLRSQEVSGEIKHYGAVSPTVATYAVSHPAYRQEHVTSNSARATTDVYGQLVRQ
ncbi:MAG TPA: hypothetical protein V6D08_07265 [Candidatus Obscuribacterales bacterium]